MILASVDWTPTLAEFRAFAALSGDDNPIHTDPDYAARHPFGQPVAHGMLIHARLVALAQSADLPPPGHSALRFANPAYADQPLRLTIQRRGASLSGRATRADGTPVCEIDWAPPALRLGAEAQLQRAFSATDLAAFAALTGTIPATSVPQALVAGLFSALLGTRLPGPGTGWLKQELHHIAPPEIDEPLIARVELTRLRPEKRLADLECSCRGHSGRLLCHGRALMLLAPDAPLQG